MPADTARHRLDAAHIDSAQAINLSDIARERGFVLKKCGRELVGPCPLCGGHDRFAISITENLFNCRCCGGKGRGAIAFLQWLDARGFRDAVETLIGRKGVQINTKSIPATGSKLNAGTPAFKNSADYELRQHDKARWLWSRRKPITGSIAETYLRQARGISCMLPPTLAFLPALKPEHHPAMIAAFGLCDEVEPGVIIAPNDVAGVHLTLLKPDGSGKTDTKPQKVFVGSPGGLPIVLAPPNDLLGLAITEGIEDALSAHQATGLGAWAAGAAGFMPKLADAVPGYIEALTIYAHDDDSNAGQRGAHALAAALRNRDIEITMEGI